MRWILVTLFIRTTATSALLCRFVCHLHLVLLHEEAFNLMFTMQLNRCPLHVPVQTLLSPISRPVIPFLAGSYGRKSSQQLHHSGGRSLFVKSDSSEGALIQDVPEPEDARGAIAVGSNIGKPPECALNHIMSKAT